MALNEKDRFYERIENRVPLNSDPRAGLREAILSNQTLKALVYIELLFEELDKKSAVNATPKTSTPTKKVDSKPKRTAKAKAEETPKVEETGESKDDEVQS